MTNDELWSLCLAAADMSPRESVRFIAKHPEVELAIELLTIRMVDMAESIRQNEGFEDETNNLCKFLQSLLNQGSTDIYARIAAVTNSPNTEERRPTIVFTKEESYALLAAGLTFLRSVPSSNSRDEFLHNVRVQFDAALDEYDSVVLTMPTNSHPDQMD